MPSMSKEKPFALMSNQEKFAKIIGEDIAKNIKKTYTKKQGITKGAGKNG